MIVKELTEEQRIDAEIEKKQTELSQLLKCEIFPLKFKDFDNEGEFVVGYMKDAPRLAKLRVMDKLYGAMYSTGAELLDVCLLKDHSDKRIWSEDPASDVYYLGACAMVNKIVSWAANDFKKK